MNTTNTISISFECTPRESAEQYFSDIYKEANGFRPRHMDLTAMSDEYLWSMIQAEEAACVAAAKVRQEAEAAAAVALEERILILIGMGADDRDHAIAWIADAEGANGDMEYLCFLLGVRYGYFKTT
jgi:hypothetical protein